MARLRLMIHPNATFGKTAGKPSSRRLSLLAMPLVFATLCGPGGGWRTTSEAQEFTTESITFFESEIRPLLSSACFDCHGAKKQESELRLDSRAAIVQGGTNGPAIVPGQPDESLLLKAVGYEGELRMPPEGKLLPAQIAALRRWIEMGAPWPRETAPLHLTRSGAPSDEEKKFWSFQPVQTPAVPGVHDKSWPWTGVDFFILARLEQAGMQAVGLADKRTLLRRVTFDLTGLPPTPEELDAFLADDRPQAYVAVVERLLASPGYGERWGRHWLDVVRYADTAGDGADYPVREAYKYRNYVIRALNADMPFDVFVREQIAGDVLAERAAAAGKIDGDRYAELVTATGYLAVTKRFGYNINTEFQHLDIADTIECLGRSLLGLSLGCARCHDHKYDPVSMEDYYGLYGILASTQFSFPGGEEHKRPHNLVPLVALQARKQFEQARQAELSQLDQQLERLAEQRRSLLDQWRFAGGVDLGFEAQTPGQAPADPWFSAGPNVVLAEAQSPYTHVHPAGARGLRIAHGQPNDGIRQSLEPPRTVANTKRYHFNLDFRNVASAEDGGSYRLYLGHGAIASAALECAVSSNAFAIRDGDEWHEVRPLESGTWYNLQLELDLEHKTYSGRVGRPGDVVAFEHKKLVPGWDGILDTFFSDGLGHQPGTKPTHDFDNFGWQDQPFAALTDGSAAEVAASPSSSPTAAREFHEQLQQLDSQTAILKQQRAASSARELYPVAYAVSEGQPIQARIQLRGEPDKLGPEVPRRFLELLGGDALPVDERGSGRLQLAEWFTRPTSPLIARVIVNRLWQHHFGRGLVPSTSDFGTRGEAPSHPELLDYLAAHFMAEGWSLKALHRLLLLSRVYQLASHDNPDNLRMDPENRRLWKFSRRRLDAESLRDAMLAISGELDYRLAGGHPFPPVESWEFTIHRPFHAIYDSPHRSVYLMVQRARRHPYLALFDAADPNISTAVRLPTTTSTQALYLLNSPFVHEQSLALARRLLHEKADDVARVELAFELAHGQRPSPAQVRRALDFVAAYRDRFAATIGDERVSREQAWAALGRVLWSSNAFLFID